MIEPGDELVYVMPEKDPHLPNVLTLGKTYRVSLVYANYGFIGWTCYTHRSCEHPGILLEGVFNPSNGHAWCSGCFRKIGDGEEVARWLVTSDGFEQTRKTPELVTA